MAISGILGAVGSLVSGFAAMQQASAQAAIAKANAERLRLQAEAAAETAQLDAMDIGQQNAGEQGMQLATMGASGLAMTSPSLIQARYNARILGIEEQYRTQYAGNIQTTDLRNQAAVEDARGKAAKQAGAFGMVQGVLGAANSFVGGASSSGFSPMKDFALNTRPTPRSTFFNTPEVSRVAWNNPIRSARGVNRLNAGRPY